MFFLYNVMAPIQNNIGNIKMDCKICKYGGKKVGKV